MKKKKQVEEEEEIFWWKSFFPQTDILFKNTISLLIVYYITIFLIETMQTINGNFKQMIFSLVILWVLLYWIINNIQQMNLNFDHYKKIWLKIFKNG